MTFGERLVKAREQANLKQNQLADLLGITPSRLNYWEKDKREPDVLMLKKISQILQVSADYLIGNNCDEEYSFHEQNLIKKYRCLSPQGKTTVDNLIDNLISMEESSPDNKDDLESLPKHQDLIGHGMAAFGGNKNKFKD